jgi:uncharacterized repeat protein (TIGR04138 family)
MTDERTEEEKLAAILKREPRFQREAYRFVQEALDFARRKLGRKGHLSGRELAEGFRDLARERFGLLAKTVLEQWGVRSTADIGSLVYNLIEEQIMVREEGKDRREDFDNVYDFERAFNDNFAIEMED